MKEKLVTVHVKVKARVRSIEESGDGLLKVRTNVAPEKGKANADVIALLAGHYKVARSCVELVSGTTSSTKRFKITY